jgi:hypothetical protein
MTTTHEIAAALYLKRTRDGYHGACPVCEYPTVQPY